MVEILTFSPLRFVEDDLGSNDYKRKVSEWFEWGHAFALNNLTTDLERYLTTYKDFIRCQRLLYEEGTAVKLLIDCFRRLRNLTGFQVCSYSPQTGSRPAELSSPLILALPTDRLRE